MSTENTNAAATAGKDTPSPKPKRGWFRRNWLWFLPTLILAIVVVGGGVVYWSVFVRVYRLDVCQSAMKAIQSDKVLQQKLGQPIHPVWWPSREFTPSSRIEKEEKEVRWKIEGPKGRASAHVQAKLRMGEWQTIIFDVTLADGK
ncbi:MAG: cytochrome c oxidase assembly factor Coa1 family protein [Thermoguttaceae bacterium]